MIVVLGGVIPRRGMNQVHVLCRGDFAAREPGRQQ